MSLIKCDILRYYQRGLWSSKWKEAQFKLYSTGDLEWNKNDTGVKSNYSVNLKPIADLICVGSFTKNVPSRPLATDTDDKLIMCFPKDKKKKIGEIFWIRFYDEAQLKAWMKEIQKFIPVNTSQSIKIINNDIQSQKTRFKSLKRTLGVNNSREYYPPAGNINKLPIPALMPIAITNENAYKNEELTNKSSSSRSNGDYSTGDAVNDELIKVNQLNCGIDGTCSSAQNNTEKNYHQHTPMTVDQNSTISFKNTTNGSHYATITLTDSGWHISDPSLTVGFTSKYNQSNDINGNGDGEYSSQHNDNTSTNNYSNSFNNYSIAYEYGCSSNCDYSSGGGGGGDSNFD